ncbi:Conserved membrane protein [Alkalibacterium sp. AK22]|uniref:TraX family protein n=1 Tax=Alkalibacterium sp. AK22 TaxID=1229520 RepID=UPI0004529E17|nr:TraX family protein [Alkalibacterium sp. AK22]EXJ23727.1 Conserved membrane protein [Alkalibacterium sp. AK22]
MTRAFDDKLNTIKWIGILTMLIDHTGYFLFPGLIWMRMIGRLAFPCFLYSTVEGTERTSDYKKYITRLFGLGVLSMPVTPNTINVLFLLGIFSLSLKYRRFFPLWLLLSFFAEYSVYGFLFGWAIYWMIRKNRWEGVLAIGIVQFFYLLLFSWPIQLLSVLSVPLMLGTKGIQLPRLPRYFFYWFYPLHQALLLLIVWVR